MKNASSTFTQTAVYSGFYASRADDSGAEGESFTDAFGLQGVALPKLSMGLAEDAARFLGTLGLGFNDSDSDTILDTMSQNGLISSSAYSLWLDDESLFIPLRILTGIHADETQMQSRAISSLVPLTRPSITGICSASRHTNIRRSISTLASVCTLSMRR